MSITPEQVASATTGQAIQSLERSFGKIQHGLDQLSDQQVWWRPEPSMNSIGNLVLHLCGNVRQWMVTGLGNLPDTRDRPSEFSERQMTGRQELIQQLAATLDDAKAMLAQQTPESLLGDRKIQGFQVSGLYAVFDSTAHFQGHTQEIICLTRMQLGDAYRFEWTPTTPEEGAPPTEPTEELR